MCLKVPHAARQGSCDNQHDPEIINNLHDLDNIQDPKKIHVPDNLQDPWFTSIFCQVVEMTR